MYITLFKGKIMSDKSKTTYVNQSLFSYSYLNIALNVSSTNNFNLWVSNSSSFHSLNYSTYLVFSYNNRNANIKDDTKLKAVYSLPHIYELKESFNMVADMLLNSFDDIYSTVNDEFVMNAEYAKFNVSIPSTTVALNLKFGIKEVEKKNTIEPVVEIRFQSKAFSVNIPVDVFLSINSMINGMDLWLMSQNLVNIYKTDKLRFIGRSSRQKVEEE
jgi:hypothetical protein